MAIEFRCPTCQKLLRVGDDAAGKQAKCPGCSSTVTVPSASAPPPAPPSFNPPPTPASGNPFGAAGQSPFGGGFAPPLAPPSDNPYAAPLSGGESNAGIARPTQISVNGVFEDAWAVFKPNMGMLIGVYFVELLITAGFNIGGSIGIGVMQGARVDAVLVAIVQLVHFVVNLLLSTWIACGRDLFVLQTAKGQSPAFSLLFNGQGILLRRILLTLLGMVVSLVLFAPSVVIGFIIYGVTKNEEPAILTGAIVAALTMIPFIWLSLTYWQAWFVFLDQPASVMEALGISRQITQGNRPSLFAIGVLSSLLATAGACACYVGMLFTIPLAMTIAIVAYMQMTGQRVTGVR